jgi:hypothetical protein
VIRQQLQEDDVQAFAGFDAGSAAAISAANVKNTRAPALLTQSKHK